MLRYYVFLKDREDTNDAHLTAFCAHMLGLRSAIEGSSTPDKTKVPDGPESRTRQHHRLLR